MRLLGKQLLAKGAEEVRFHEHVEPDLAQEFALHPV
jgi:hypothetical protein